MHINKSLRKEAVSKLGPYGNLGFVLSRSIAVDWKVDPRRPRSEVDVLQCLRSTPVVDIYSQDVERIRGYFSLSKQQKDERRERYTMC